MRVCLICEGCYPYVPGGVSSWIQMLCSQFRDIEFVIWAIATTREEMSEYAYQIPPNVKEIRTLYLGDEAFQRTRRKITLSKQEKETLKSLMVSSVDSINWVEVLELIKKYRRRMSGIVMSESFFEICLEEYRRQNSKKVFHHFLWNFRGIYFPLMYILSQLSEHGIYTREREEDIIRSQWVAGDFKEIWIDFFKKLSFIAYRQASAVTSLFETNRSLQVELNCPAEKIRVIPNGVEAAEYDVCRVEKAFSSENVLLGAVLRVVPIKDVKTMLLAFDIVKRAAPGARLRLMGNCRENPEYYQECLDLLAELKTADVEFAGQVNIKEHLPEIDLLLLSSISEGQPLAILEGMAAGIPFVTTNVGNCKALLEGEREDDHLGAAGLVVPVMNSQAMAEAILHCIRNPGLRRRMGEVGRKRVERYYSRRDMLTAFHDLYESLEESGYGGNRI